MKQIVRIFGLAAVTIFGLPTVANAATCNVTVTAMNDTQCKLTYRVREFPSGSTTGASRAYATIAPRTLLNTTVTMYSDCSATRNISILFTEVVGLDSSCNGDSYLYTNNKQTGTTVALPPLRAQFP